MKSIFLIILLGVLMVSCKDQGTTTTSTPTDASSPTLIAGQSAVQDNESMKDVVKVAVGSPDHKTLVTAVIKAELVDALSNAGPFTEIGRASCRERV